VIWLILALALALVGGCSLGWWARGWWCQRMNPTCPVWQQERKRAWKAWLRNRYPNGSRERHPTPPAEVLDNGATAAVPSQIKDTPATGVANPRRKT
jgi:hypothetical protein